MFRIGEFSKIAQVSGRLLRYYDEIGLLKPQYISATDKANFEKDPMHKTIEEALYPSTIDDVIWISGKIHPMMVE